MSCASRKIHLFHCYINEISRTKTSNIKRNLGALLNQWKKRSIISLNFLPIVLFCICDDGFKMNLLHSADIQAPIPISYLPLMPGFYSVANAVRLRNVVAIRRLQTPFPRLYQIASICCNMDITHVQWRYHKLRKLVKTGSYHIYKIGTSMVNPC